jgi:hypothetical protein
MWIWPMKDRAQPAGSDAEANSLTVRLGFAHRRRGTSFIGEKSLAGCWLDADK